MLCTTLHLADAFHFGASVTGSAIFRLKLLYARLRGPAASPLEPLYPSTPISIYVVGSHIHILSLLSSPDRPRTRMASMPDVPRQSPRAVQVYLAAAAAAGGAGEGPSLPAPEPVLGGLIPPLPPPPPRDMPPRPPRPPVWNFWGGLEMTTETSVSLIFFTSAWLALPCAWNWMERET